MIKKGTKEKYSSNKTNISETSQELAYQQLLIEKRDSEQFLKTIAPKYMGVYVLNRKTDLFRDILGPDYFRAIVQDKGGYYSLAIKKYNATFVLKEDQSVLQYALNYDRIYEILLSGKSVNLSYRKKDGTFVSLKIDRYSDRRDEKNLSLWVFTNETIDEERKANESQKRVSDALEEAQKANNELLEALKKIEKDKSVLDKLCSDFTAVYYVECNSGQYEILKMNSQMNIESIVDKMKILPKDFYELARIYANKYLLEKDREAFMKWFSLDHLKNRLRKVERATYHYQSLPNLNGNQYFAAQAILLGQDAEHFHILLGFRFIDDVIKKEKAIQENIQKALDEAQLQNEIISAISKNYSSIYRINLEKDFYEEIASDGKTHHFIEKKGPAQEKLNSICQNIVTLEYRSMVKSFFDLSTLAERLKQDEFLMTEYQVLDGNWQSFQFIVKKRNEAGVVTHVLCAINSITDAKRKEMNYQFAVASAKRETEMKSRFLANMSHDIRTPLNGIIGMVNLANQNADNVEVLRQIREKMMESLKYLVSLVNDILDMNKLQSGELKNQELTFDLAKILQKLNQIYAQRSKEKNIQYIVDWKQSGIRHPILTGNPVYLGRILSIIGDNAIKFSQPNTCIRVWAKTELQKDHRVLVTFYCKDQGVGMNKEFLNHAFELFTQEQQTSRSQYQGTGLGLAIAKQLADRMGGTIELLSKVGKGTTAIVQIPFKMGKKDSRLITHASEDISVKGLRALVAEDNDLNMEVIQFMLEDNDVEVLGAKDGKEALDFFEKSQPGYFDVIFMDIMMPHLNGLDATRAIRALNRHDAQEIPIIAVSANAFAEDIIESHLAGMDDHLAKPLDEEIMISTLKQCLAKNSAMKL